MQVISADGVTPMENPVLLPTDGATLAIGGPHLTAIFQMRKPLPSEVDMVGTGKSELGFVQSGTTGILIARFSKPFKEPIVQEMPFHMGKLPEDLRWLPERQPHQMRLLLVQLQDDRGVCHVLRMMTLSPQANEDLDRIVAKQIAESGPGWSADRHDREVDMYQRRNPDLVRLAKKLFANSNAKSDMH